MSAYDEEREGLVSYEIIYRILSHIENKGRSLKTRILYASNLNSRSLEKYLEFLQRNNLISEVCVDGRRFYVLTTKGRGFLYKLRKVREDMGDRHSRRLSDLIKDEYLREGITISTHDLSNKKRLHVIIVDGDSTIREAVTEIMINYVSARIDNEEVLGVVPSRLYDKMLEALDNIKNINSLRLYVYNEREDLKDLITRITSVLRNLESKYVVIV